LAAERAGNTPRSGSLHGISLVWLRMISLGFGAETISATISSAEEN